MRIRRTRGQRSHGLVRTYVWLMLVCTALAVAPAVLLTASRTSYESTAQVLVRPTVTESGSILAASMPTEQQYAVSGSVLTRASSRLDGTITVEQIRDDLEVSVPVDASVLDFTFTAATEQRAAEVARAVSMSYIEERNYASERPQVELITPAPVPDKPVAPDYALIVGVALIGGLAVGFAAAYAWDRLSGRLRSVEDVGARTGLPVLATLPHLSRQRARSGITPDPGMSRAFSQLASRVPGLVESRKEFTLLVTGATAHAGSSTIARQTALALARMGKRVILVCADPESWGVEKNLDVARAPGLSDLIAGTATPEQALHDTAVPGLRVLPRGTSQPARAGDQQSLDELQLLIWTLASDAIVIIDAPAVLSSASAALLGYVADEILLVVDLAHGSRASAHEAAECLAHVADKVVGCVTNQPARVSTRRPEKRPVRPAKATEAVAPAR